MSIVQAASQDYYVKIRERLQNDFTCDQRAYVCSGRGQQVVEKTKLAAGSISVAFPHRAGWNYPNR